MCVYVDVYVYVYVYLYIYMCVCTCICICIYIYTNHPQKNVDIFATRDAGKGTLPISRISFQSLRVACGWWCGFICLDDHHYHHWRSALENTTKCKLRLSQRLQKGMNFKHKILGKRSYTVVPFGVTIPTLTSLFELVMTHPPAEQRPWN